MKIEVGMYVRTDLGEIAKVVAESSYWVNIDKFKKDDITLRIVKKIDILKASHNIIDLIEVGDYVNGYRVITIIDCELRVDGFSWGTNIIKDYDIETVLTHEQFESMAYKVVKQMSEEEIKLLNEMKSRCLEKGQYVDEKAKDKFNLLCCLECYVIKYEELQQELKQKQDVIDDIREYIEKTLCDMKSTSYKGYLQYILSILEREENNENKI